MNFRAFQPLGLANTGFPSRLIPIRRKLGLKHGIDDILRTLPLAISEYPNIGDTFTEFPNEGCKLRMQCRFTVSDDIYSTYPKLFYPLKKPLEGLSLHKAARPQTERACAVDATQVTVVGEFDAD